MKTLKLFLLIIIKITLLNNFILAQDFSQYSYEELDSLQYEKRSRGHLKEAIPYALEIRNRVITADDTADTIYVEATMSLGYIYTILEQYDIAESYLLEAKTILGKLVGEKDPYYADIFSYLSILYYEKGQFDKAEPYYIGCRDIYANTLGKGHPYYAVSINNLAYFYSAMGDYELSESLNLEMLNILENNGDTLTHQYAVGLSNLALLYKSMRQYKKSVPLYLRAKVIFDETIGADNPFYNRLLGNLAGAYQYIEEYELAEFYFKKALKINEQKHGKENRSYAIQLNNIGFLYEVMGKLDQAQSFYLEALSIYQKIVSPDNLDYLRSVNNLADLYLMRGNDQQAFDYSILVVNTCSGHPLNKQIDQAWADSIRQIRFASYQHTERFINALVTLYRYFDNASQKTTQLIITELALDLIKKSKDSFSGEQEKLRLLSMSNQWMRFSLNILDLKKETDRAFQIAESNKAGLLLEAVQTSQAYNFGELPDSIVNQEKKLYKKHGELEAILLESRNKKNTDSLRIILNELTQEIQAFKIDIEKKHPRYAAMKYHPSEANIQDIQTLIDEKTALIEYAIGDSALYIFYVDKQVKRTSKIPISIPVLKKNIRRLHEILSSYAVEKDEETAYNNYTEVAHWFYKNLVKSVLIEEKGIEQLIIIPDGELGHIPFESFLVEQPIANPANMQPNYAELHYLLKDFKISYHYSATLWKENVSSHTHQNNQQILAMAANYTGTIDSLRSALRLPAYQRMRQILQALPAARQEVEALSKQFEGFFGFDNQASEKIFKEKANNYAVIHLAMHGLLDSKNPILSSLAFTEDGDNTENNFLQAYEISKMELKADLVVLSACETGYGKFEMGNGTASLARAFMYAGVPSLVVSLWQVNDASTSMIMQSFYQNLTIGMDKAAALQLAKLDYIKKVDGIAAHPSYWAPFVQLGDNRPIKIAKKSNNTTLAIALGIGAGLLALILILLMRNRQKFNAV